MCDHPWIIRCGPTVVSLDMPYGRAAPWGTQYETCNDEEASAKWKEGCLVWKDLAYARTTSCCPSSISGFWKTLLIVSPLLGIVAFGMANHGRKN